MVSRILSRLPSNGGDAAACRGSEDDHARFIEAVVSTRTGALRIASIYLPNGNPIGLNMTTKSNG